jgi:hypothetical protein
VTDLFRTGTYLRCPGGNVENVPEQIAAGMTWALLNIGDDPCVRRDPAVWDHQRFLYRATSLPHGPWLHVRSLADLDFLIRVGVEWQADVIGCNIEDVVEDGLSLREVGRRLLGGWVQPFGKPVHMATLPWVQNGQGWQHVAFAYLALEMFPLEGGQPYLDEWERCVDHAFAEGAERVTLLYSTTSPRSVYPNVAHCLYTADNVTDWRTWKDAVPQPVPRPPAPPTPPEVPMLTVKQFPYTGPCFGPGPKQTLNYSTVKGIKRAMIRLGLLDQKLGEETDDFGSGLRQALKEYQRASHLTVTGDYRKGTWLALRSERLETGPHAGEYAIDRLGRRYVQEDVLTMCYPHPEWALSQVCQGPHQTDGLPWTNWAIDFCAPGGTPVLAVERATITRLSGHDPNYPPNNAIGIWGWSIYYETADGGTYFSTHYGSRSVKLGQVVEVGTPIGLVGSWPGNPSRSHTHLGYSHPKGSAYAKAHILEVANAPRFPLL